ncbi:ligase-associated DNA damage response endonuclease PdeM [Roseicyclus mahoneyensis]|uniref:Putative phosphoesterase n=1 Tax=Roseicyclus mahoneyensis TaxID=164332 RepID=A0A316GFK2_9RHOB|nr:ligase-associated DNA damage response endonuclease PdeM [Roseicyclus mahoneyensis]PWK59403.1 putative phosphoesterase [Roseicyclus mahoneyensis]
MNNLPFEFQGETLHLLPSGALYWPARRLLCVADLHLGKSERLARLGGPILPPYENEETIDRLSHDIATTDPAEVICLGDSFDDLAASRALPATIQNRLTGLMAGRGWVWVLGNHDPGPVDLGGTCRADHRAAPLVFRHIAEPDARGEVSGHYHPKARIVLGGRSIVRRCALLDADRVILPAYGAYTGGMLCDRPELACLFSPRAEILVLGPRPMRFPVAHSSMSPARRNPST